MRTKAWVLGLALVLATATLGGFAGAAAEGSPQVWLVAPVQVRFTPEAQIWPISVAALTLGRFDREVTITGVRCGEHEIPLARALGAGSLVPKIAVPGATQAALNRWMELRDRVPAGLLASEEAEFCKVNALVEEACCDIAPTWVYLTTADFPFDVKDQQDYPITLAIDVGGTPKEVTVLVLSRTLPSDTSWSPAELHIHTTVSDGHSSPGDIATLYQAAGYRIAYVTDHTDGIAVKTWTEYSKDVKAATKAGIISLYPGAEVTVGTWTFDELGNPIFTSAGDCLAYGVASLTGLTNKYYTPQGEIDQVLANNPSGPSSPAIAHPYNFFYPWTDWTVVRYRGMELMASGQTNFADTASPMVKWRAELTRLLTNTFTYGYFASARTGGDFHGTATDTIPTYVTWLRTSSWSTQSSVDSAIYNGRTVASRYGGLGYMTISYNTTTGYVGDRLTGIPTNATLKLSIVFKPVQTGTYTIKVWRNNKQTEVFSYSGSYTGGSTYNPCTNYSFIFPGGSNYYYLYISGPGVAPLEWTRHG